MDPKLKPYLEAAELDLPGATIAALEAYAALIIKWDRITNLIGSDSSASGVFGHIGDCLMLVPHLDSIALADIGAGAGLPGLVVALTRPQCAVTLVEANARKARFLTQVKIELGLDNVTVAAERAQQWQAPSPLGQIVCRGYSSLAKFFSDTRHLHRRGLQLFAMKGVVPVEEIEELGLPSASIEIRKLATPGWDHRHLVVIDIA